MLWVPHVIGRVNLEALLEKALNLIHIVASRRLRYVCRESVVAYM